MKSETQIRNRIKQLEEKLPRLEKLAKAPGVIPGPHAVGRANYKMGKQLDAENERRSKAFLAYENARKELATLQAKLNDYLSGERHINGQPRADAPSRQRYANERAKLDAFMHDLIKVGDQVAIALNPTNLIEVKRVNKKTVTDEAGELWTYAEIIPVSDGKAMSTFQVVELYKEWAATNDPS